MITAELQRPTNSEISFSSPLGKYIDHFDQNWKAEGLPKDWFNLQKRVGFSMDLQMQLLQGTDQRSVDLWTDQTKQDVLGFALEYLSQGLVFPIRYETREGADGAPQLYDPKYGKSMLSGVSEDERNGEVMRSLSRIQDFFLDPKTPDGSFAVMPSPKGETGLTTDDGKAITYPDSYFYVMAKLGNEIRGFTIKTDFSLQECRRVIKNLTGTELPENAPVEEYVSALALIKKEDNFGIENIIDILKNSRNGSKFAFEDRGWSEVEKDIKRGFELYNFNQKTQNIISDFEEYAKSGFHCEITFRKALGATILRLSKLFLFDDNRSLDQDFQEYNMPIIMPITFGDVLEKVSKITGCAGGGIASDRSTNIIDSLIPRIGKNDVEDESYSFDKHGECVVCNQKAMVGPCDICRNCDSQIRNKTSVS